MAVSSLQSGYNLINQSSQMVTKASQEIQSNHADSKNEVDDGIKSADNSSSNVNSIKTSPKSSDTSGNDNNTDALVQLNQAAQYNKVGTSIVQKNQEMLGSLLDVRI